MEFEIWNWHKLLIGDWPESSSKNKDSIEFQSHSIVDRQALQLVPYSRYRTILHAYNEINSHLL